ncbi:MAG: hypothetical protein A2293_15900 [Elusimicrobia bacterium RIFOXYB2_FULL_49_7]|nr:MAG: hypothetical protein A2293_15900 [Elusimicrobia bacterium RIFOXYB2_FULL_49_7]
MTFGLLQADHARTDLQSRFGDYPDIFSAFLKKSGLPAINRIYDLQANHFPKTVDDCDVYLITGSKSSVYEEAVWIKQLIAFTQHAFSAKKKLLGICFGHQMLAHALGGRTVKSEKGWGVGLKTFSLLKQKTWMEPPLSEVSLLYSHQDQVQILPPGSELLGGNDFCPHQMFCMGNQVLGIQGHPEFTPDYLSALMEPRIPIIGVERHAEAAASLDKPSDAKVIGQWMIRFLNQ